MLLQLIRNILYALINVYEFILIARALVSWFPIDQGNPIISFLYTVTEPVLRPVRDLLMRIPALQSLPIDFSIIVVFFILGLVRFIV